MTTMQKPASRRRTRKSKVEDGEEKIIKEKFAEERKIPPLQAKTGNQKIALNYFAEGRQLIILSGAAGTGKSMLAAYQGTVLLRSNKVNKLVLVRPMVSSSNSLGLLPGSVFDKLSPSLAPILGHLEKFLGKPVVEAYLNSGQIELMPLEHLRGASFESSVVIAEEVQNCTPNEMMSLVTRIGEGSFLFVTGDKKQNDLRGKQTGIEYIVHIVEKYSDEYNQDQESAQELRTNVGIVNFTNDDCVRSGITRAFVKAFNREGI